MSQEFAEQLAAVSHTAAQVAADCRDQPAQQVLKSFADAGLLGAIAPEEVGGLALALPFASAIVAAASAELLADTVAEALIAARFAAEMDRALARSIIEGKALVTLDWHDGLSAHRREGGLLVSGSVANVVLGAQASHLLARVDLQGQSALVLLDLASPGVLREPAQSFDLERPRAHLQLHEVRVSAAQATSDATHLNDWLRTVLVLQAQTLASQAGACLQKTADYLGARRQFGQALASLQTVRFTLAQFALELENLRMLVREAGAPDAGQDLTQAEMAYAYAAKVCPGIAEKCLHLHGGMGFTWDVPMHRYLRRIRALTDDHTAASARGRVAALVLGDGAAVALTH